MAALFTEVVAGRQMASYLEDLDHICQLAPQDAVREVGGVLRSFARRQFLLDPQLYTFLHTQERAVPNRPVGPPSPYIALSQEDTVSGYALQLFVWPAGAVTQIHDHSCWGAIYCASGELTEERYARLDDGLRENQARLKKMWTRSWQSGSDVSTLLPYEGGIHRVRNSTGHTALSVHVYGPIGEIDGRDYDPLRDYVCDRPVGVEVALV